jgi:hypothetical protein
MSSEDARGELSRAISAQLARAGGALESKTDVPSSVHEARRAIKRTRALLKLADPRPRVSHTDRSLREASRALAVLRDTDKVTLTAEDIRADARSPEPNVIPLRMLESLKAERERRFAEASSADGPLRVADDLLRSIIVQIGESQAPPSHRRPRATRVGRHGASTARSRCFVRICPDPIRTPVKDRQMNDPTSSENGSKIYVISSNFWVRANQNSAGW